jgi:hypothetical protein
VASDQRAGVLDVDALRRDVDRLRQTYQAASPFPHAVIDDVLPTHVFARAMAEFPAADHPMWSPYLHINEAKFAATQPATWGPTLRAVAEALAGDDFVGWLGELTGFGGLLADPLLDGGGLHQTVRGGHLNIHADFTAHHRIANWRRRVNVLLYLNDSWDESWGGELELWDTRMRRCVRRVSPVGNRMLVFTTSPDAYHGHPEPLQCPPDVARRSMALYYFTQEEHAPRRATRYRPRPGDGLKSVAIWADRVVLDVYDRVKVRLGRTDAMANGVAGRAYRVLTRSRPRR